MNTDKMIYWTEGLFLTAQHFQFLDKSIKDNLHFLLNKLYVNNNGFVDYNIDLDLLKKGTLTLNNCKLFLNNTYIDYPTNSNIISRNIITDEIKNNSNLKFYLGIKKLYKDNMNIEIKHIKDLKNKNLRYSNIETEFEKVSSIYQEDDKVDFSYIKYTIQIFTEEEKTLLVDYDLIPLCVVYNKNDEYYIDESFIPPLISIHTNNELLKVVSSIINEIKLTIQYLEKDKLKSKNIILLTNINPLLLSINDVMSGSFINPYHLFQEFRKIASVMIVFTKSYSMDGLLQKESNFLAYEHNNIYESFNVLNTYIKNILNEIITKEVEVQTEFILNMKKTNDIYYIDIDNKFFLKEYAFYLEIISDINDEIVKNINYVKISDKNTIDTIIASSTFDIKFNIQNINNITFPTQANSIYLKIDLYDESWEKIKSLKNLAIYADDLKIEDLNLLIVEE